MKLDVHDFLAGSTFGRSRANSAVPNISIELCLLKGAPVAGLSRLLSASTSSCSRAVGGDDDSFAVSVVADGGVDIICLPINIVSRNTF